MTELGLPEGKGTYVLIVVVPQMKRLEIGRLCTYDVVPGFCAYVGSAFGAGGLRARIQHHLASGAEPHWQIDYLLAVAEPVEAVDRLLKSFSPLAEAAGYSSELEYPLFPDLNEPLGGKLKEHEGSRLFLAASWAVLCYAPKGTRPPEIFPEELEAKVRYHEKQ
jgi:hypothetical protein